MVDHDQRTRWIGARPNWISPSQWPFVTIGHGEPEEDELGAASVVVIVSRPLTELLVVKTTTGDPESVDIVVPPGIVENSREVLWVPTGDSVLVSVSNPLIELLVVNTTMGGIVLVTIKEPLVIVVTDSDLIVEPPGTIGNPEDPMNGDELDVPLPNGPVECESGCPVPPDAVRECDAPVPWGREELPPVPRGPV